MRKRSSKAKDVDDVNVIAHRILREATGEAEPTRPEEPTKNPAAVALGQLGGLKGGKAQAKSLSTKKRSAIAKKAAKARWDR